MDLLRQDLRYSLRRLAASPGFTLIAILSLAIGIGANTAIFSIVNAVLLRTLPVTEPERLVDVFTSDSDSGIQATSSYPDFLDIAALDVFADATAYELFIAPVERGDVAPDLLIGEVVTPGYFSTLGIQPMLGRALRADVDDVRRGSPVVLLGHAYWQREFGGDPSAVGQNLRIGSTTWTVIGVMAPEFAGMTRGIVPDVYAPMAMVETLKGSLPRLEMRASRSLFIRARLAPGVTPLQADAAVRALGARLGELHPESNARRTMSAVRTTDVKILPVVDRVLTPVAALLLAMVGLVLLIACANLAGFLLARATDRRQEIAVRLALGARRAHLVRQLLVESFLLALAGGVAGVAVAWIAVRTLTGFQPPLPIPIRLDIPLDRAVLLFNLLVSAFAGLAFGLVPAVHATRPDLTPTLRDEAGSTGRRRALLRHGLVVGQVAVSMLLMIGAGLFVRSLVAAQEVDPGFDTGPAAILRVAPEMIGYDAERQRVYFERLLEDLRALPGVTGVTLADRLPLGAEIQTQVVNFEGVQAPPDQEGFSLDFANIEASYFDVMGIPIIAGRTFTAADHAGSARAAVLSETAAQRFFPDGDAVGRVFHLGAGTDTPVRVVGIARDTRVRTLGEPARPYIYMNAVQSAIGAIQVVARGTASPDRLLAEMRRVARRIEPRMPFFEAKTMEQHLSVMLFPPRMAALLLSVFGGLGLLLATIGIWGIVSYAVARRAREVAIRLAVGASAREVIFMLTSGGVRLVGLGALIGLVLAFAASRLLARFLFGAGALDVVAFTAVPLALATVGILAAWLPARRAARVQPMRALRVD